MPAVLSAGSSPELNEIEEPTVLPPGAVFVCMICVRERQTEKCVFGLQFRTSVFFLKTHPVTHLDHFLFDPHRRELGGVNRETRISRDQPPEHHSTHINRLGEKEEWRHVRDSIVILLKFLFFTNLVDVQTFLLNYFVESVLIFEYFMEPHTALGAQLQPVQALPHPGITWSEATQRCQHLR